MIESSLYNWKVKSFKINLTIIQGSRQMFIEEGIKGHNRPMFSESAMCF